jgi:two-component system sensor histidine kinase KdpD
MNHPDDMRLLKTKLTHPGLISGIWQYIVVTLTILVSSWICFHFTEYIGYQSVSFILLFVVSILSIFMGIGPITLASSLSAFIWNFFFIPPKFTVNIDKTEDALMFAMFFIIALVNGVFTSRVRRQERLTHEREERTNSLYQLTRGLANSKNIDELVDTAIKNIKENFGFDVIIILQDGNNRLTEYSKDPLIKKLSSEETGVAEWVFEHSLKAGKYTDSLKSENYTFYPMMGSSIKPGVMAVKHPGPIHGNNDEFWDTFVTQISNAIEKEFLNEFARKARFLNESDKLYKTLFNSISHELRIPVATIMSASESLLASQYPEDIRKELSHEILKASNRLNRLIENLLNMSRLESGRITPNLDWCDIYDLINKVTDSLQDELKPFQLQVEIGDDMPFVKIDFGLMEQVLYNLIYNATQYASISTNLRVKASYDSGMMTIQVLDRGPGVPEKEIPLIFNKFYRIEGSKTGGTGLGLSIARGFTEAHKGTITAENRQNGGAKFTVTIPTEIPQEKFGVN